LRKGVRFQRSTVSFLSRIFLLQRLEFKYRVTVGDEACQGLTIADLVVGREFGNTCFGESALFVNDFGAVVGFVEGDGDGGGCRPNRVAPGVGDAIGWVPVGDTAVFVFSLIGECFVETVVTLPLKSDMAQKGNAGRKTEKKHALARPLGINSRLNEKIVL